MKNTTSAMLRGGLLRLRLTDRCNAQCVFCGLHPHEIEHPLDMEPEWLYNDFVPLYKEIKILLLTGGEPLLCKGAFEYVSHIAREYPHINVIVESNGLVFDRKWQELAADNLLRVHFSLNAARPETFRKGVWCAQGAEQAFARTAGNVSDFVRLLQERDRLAFGPSVSMVVNRHTAPDIRLFVQSALAMGARQCMFYFDYSENQMHQMYFACPDIMRPALVEIMKLEKVLKGRFFIYWHLWHPLAEPGLAQPALERIPAEALANEYSDLLQLAERRSIAEEHKTRNRLRQKHGKTTLSLEEDMLPSLHLLSIGERTVCFAPWQEVDIHPSGRVDFCGWFEKPMLKIQDYVTDGALDWDAIVNSKEWVDVRRRMLRGDYNGCMLCCPMNRASRGMLIRGKIRHWLKQLGTLHTRKEMPKISKVLKTMRDLARLRR